jgi:hypothetical protein
MQITKRSIEMKHYKYKLLITFLISLIFICDMTCAQDKKGSQQEQTFFPSDDPDEVYIHKPITLPEEAIQTLKSSDAGSKCLKAYDHKFDVAWVVGSEVHLSGAGETAIVVMPNLLLQTPPGTPPDNSCIRGARTVPFWVLRKGDKGYQLLLEVGASALYIDNSRHNGYLDIIASTANFSDTVDVYYRFDGRRYQEFERKVIKRE